MTIIAADGSQKITLLGRPEDWKFYPRWSPDGTMIAYDEKGLQRPLGLVIINADGTNERYVRTDTYPTR